jgi:hypothetical protein
VDDGGLQIADGEFNPQSVIAQPPWFQVTLIVKGADHGLTSPRCVCHRAYKRTCAGMFVEVNCPNVRDTKTWGTLSASPAAVPLVASTTAICAPMAFWARARGPALPLSCRRK